MGASENAARRETGKAVREAAGELASDCPRAQEAFGRATLDLLGHRNTTLIHLDQALQEDPDLAAAYLLKGFGLRVLGRRDLRGSIQELLQKAQSAHERRGGLRERALIDGLGAWLAGRADRAGDILERGLEERPDDLLTMKLTHAIRFMMGDTVGLLRAIDLSVDALEPGSAGAGFARGCRAFALAESGRRDEAKADAETALATDRRDAWALHALAHVLYESGAMAEGADLLTDREDDLPGLNNFAGHLAWHEALFHIESGNPERALLLHDHRVAVYPPHDYRDVSNASTLLLLLEDHGIDVGDRWLYLASIARSRMGDHSLAFADIHYVLALAGAGYPEEASAFIASMQRAAGHRRDDFDAQVLLDVGTPVAEAILSATQGDFAGASKTVRGLSHELHRMGGSRAQRRVIPWVLRSAKTGKASLSPTRPSRSGVGSRDATACSYSPLTWKP